jgi:uncharacterized damage-inducible protein DinB
MSDPKGVLRDYLGQGRRHVLGILEGLSDEDLRRPLLPSGWSCLGLVQHLALDVEQFWFRRVVAGETLGSDDPVTENAWQPDPAVPAEVVLDLYRRECERSDEVLAATDLDAPPRWWPDWFGAWRMDDLREIAMHVVTETACHAGHLDTARELVDGRQWMVLTES